MPTAAGHEEPPGLRFRRGSAGQDGRRRSGAGRRRGRRLSTNRPLAPGEAAPDRIFSFADSLEQAARGGAEEAAAPEVLTSWVTFGLADEVFALPVEPVREVLRVTSITRVPHAPQPIRGVTNLRGRVIPVIDLKMRIGLEAADLDRASRVIVVGSRGRLLGLLVDVVLQVVHIDLNQVQPPPEDVMTVQSDYILGVFHRGDQLILLFDVDRALVIKDPTPQGVEETA